MKNASILTFLALAVGTVNANNQKTCDPDRTCNEVINMPCDEFVASYIIEGACCAIEDITASNTCRVVVGGKDSAQNGLNCYWYPRCGIPCVDRTDPDWKDTGECLEYINTSPDSCPTTQTDGSPLKYKTNWKVDPLPLTEYDYSCAPSMVPSMSNMPSISASTSVPTRQVIIGIAAGSAAAAVMQL